VPDDKYSNTGKRIQKIPWLKEDVPARFFQNAGDQEKKRTQYIMEISRTSHGLVDVCIGKKRNRRKTNEFWKSRRELETKI
jgi:hypothetical protein